MLDAFKVRTNHMFSVGVSTIPNVDVTCKISSAINKLKLKKKKNPQTNLESIIYMCETTCHPNS